MPSTTRLATSSSASLSHVTSGASAWSPLSWVRRTPSLGAPLPAVPHNIGHTCPITLELIAELDDVVHAEDNYLYERSALAHMLSLSPRSPISRLPMPHTTRQLLGVAVTLASDRCEGSNSLSAFEMIVVGELLALTLGGAVGAVQGIRFAGAYALEHDSYTALALRIRLKSSGATLGAVSGAAFGTFGLVACMYAIELYLTIGKRFSARARIEAPVLAGAS